MDKRFENIEVRMAYLETTVEQLNQVVIKQQDQIDLLTEEIRRQQHQLEKGAEFVRPLSEETPPPHY
jgi:SlyX protein